MNHIIKLFLVTFSFCYTGNISRLTSGVKVTSEATVEGEKIGDGTNSNKCTGPRKLQSHKRFLNIDARPIASFTFLPGALCFFI
jgi:hypothetical protein